mgnify:CR=1 FL=1
MKILIGEILYEREISYKKLSIMTGIPKSSISDICNGISVPRLDTLEIIAKALNMRISDLFESDFK